MRRETVAGRLWTAQVRGEELSPGGCWISPLDSIEWRHVRGLGRVAVLLDGREVDRDSVVDELCGSPGCVNPAHLVVVMSPEAIRRHWERGVIWGRHPSETPRCRRGHWICAWYSDAERSSFSFSSCVACDPERVRGLFREWTAEERKAQARAAELAAKRERVGRSEVVGSPGGVALDRFFLGLEETPQEALDRQRAYVAKLVAEGFGAGPVGVPRIPGLVLSQDRSFWASQGAAQVGAGRRVAVLESREDREGQGE